MQVQSIKEQVYEGILKDVLDGVYEANDILTERTLVEKYGVSKTPVREALVHLGSDGILNSIPRLGYQVASISPREIIEVLELRKVIELGSLEMCFSQLTEEQINELKKMNEEVIKIAHTKDIALHWKNNQDFHKKLCSFSNNRYLQKTLEDALNVCTIISNQYFTKVWNESKVTDAGNHILFIEAIEAGDLERAKEILKEDVEAFKYGIL